jgi:glyoxylase-like metal-dependent hydrolase (beta-lactamase superfamily II)
MARRPTAHWADPGCDEVADGVFRIPLQMPNDGLHAVNVYALETSTGLAMVDGGWRTPTGIAELSSALGSVGHGLEEIHDVYVTHVHRDHYTLAVELRRRFGTRVHLGQQESPGLHELLEITSNVPSASLRELRRSGDPDLADLIESMTAAEPFDADGWEKPDTWTRPGELAVGGRRLEAVHTPGHTKGHLVFHDLDNQLVFSGDHILPGISPSIGFELGEWELPLGQYLSSLELVLMRPDARLLPAHGAPGPSVHARATQLLEHHEIRLGATREALDRSGPTTASAVARLLTWTRRERAYDELDDFNRMIATCETIAHLDVLVDRGEAAVQARESGSVFSLR